MASWDERKVTDEHILNYVDSATAPPKIKAALETLPFERNIFKILANAPNYFPAFMQLLACGFSPEKALLPSEWQITILTTAITLDAPYEYDVNYPVAKLLSWPEEKFQALRAGQFASSPLFTAREKMIASLVVEVAHANKASIETMMELKKAFTDEEITEIFILHGIYASIARLMNSARIDFDPSIPNLDEMLAKTFAKDIERDQQARQQGPQ